MCLYVSLTFRIYLEQSSVSVGIKTCPCWMCYECVQFQIEIEKISSPFWFKFSGKRKILSFHVVVLQRTAKKCTKNHNARAQLLQWRRRRRETSSEKIDHYFPLNAKNFIHKSKTTVLWNSSKCLPYFRLPSIALRNSSASFSNAASSSLFFAVFLSFFLSWAATAFGLGFSLGVSFFAFSCFSAGYEPNSDWSETSVAFPCP